MENANLFLESGPENSKHVVARAGGAIYFQCATPYPGVSPSFRVYIYTWGHQYNFILYPGANTGT
jgi:hypothetical protein